ncbi:hypothetical protein [Cyanobium sp. CH-040]|uniref:hypothetical protein n=1 Tax=Cyanobium sp. CH-040 TaxID=2823708 RepID=UPI0020CC4904|nr:hypothetical protein [Cyanobium sp. CH-040]MCP9928340.1 hypothetical protein [Cyanobium sp. CH-040]
MPAPQSLMQAAFARLGARLGSGLLDAAANAAVALQDAPELWRRELRLFWEEVEQEAERLERGPSAHDPSQASGSQPETATSGAAAVGSDPHVSAAELQDRIDALRAQVAGFSRRLDQTP